MTFAETRALTRAITEAAIETSAAEHIEVKCVVVTREQYGAILAVHGRPRLETKHGDLAVVCDEDIGKPLPDGHWQILDFIPKRSNVVARDLIGDVLVSTVDLAAGLEPDAIAICFGPAEPRYECSVLHNTEDDSQDRTRRLFTRESALAAHAEEVAKVRTAAEDAAS